MTWHLYSRGSATGIYLQNAPFFPTFLPADIRWGQNGIWNVSVISTTQINNKQLEFTVDGGVTWFPLNTQGPISANDERIFNIKATDKELFNLRCIGAGGCTIYRVLVSMAPEDIMRPSSDLQVNVPSPLPVDICPVTCDLPVINGSVTPLDVSIVNPPGTPVGSTILNITDTAYVANADVSGVDLSPTGTSAGESVIFRILWSFSVVGVMSGTLDGTNFVEFNNGANLRADSVHIFDIVVDHGDSFNLKFNKSGQIRFVRVVQLL